jgi:hypothetical protein
VGLPGRPVVCVLRTSRPSTERLQRGPRLDEGSSSSDVRPRAHHRNEEQTAIELGQALEEEAWCAGEGGCTSATTAAEAGKLEGTMATKEVDEDTKFAGPRVRRSSKNLVPPDSRSRVLVVQVQLHRCPTLAVDEVRDLLVRIARDSGVVQRRRFTTKADGSYCNYAFSTTDAGRLWVVIRRMLLDSRSLGRKVRKASIVVCSGEREDWNSYVLLHHFDKAERLDMLAGC